MQAYAKLIARQQGSNKDDVFKNLQMIRSEYFAELKRSQENKKIATKSAAQVSILAFMISAKSLLHVRKGMKAVTS
jgi:hypothetical protein